MILKFTFSFLSYLSPLLVVSAFPPAFPAHSHCFPTCLLSSQFVHSCVLYYPSLPKYIPSFLNTSLHPFLPKYIPPSHPSCLLTNSLGLPTIHLCLQPLSLFLLSLPSSSSVLHPFLNLCLFLPASFCSSFCLPVSIPRSLCLSSGILSL